VYLLPDLLLVVVRSTDWFDEVQDLSWMLVSLHRVEEEWVAGYPLPGQKLEQLGCLQVGIDPMTLGIQGVLTGYCIDEVQLCCQ